MPQFEVLRLLCLYQTTGGQRPLIFQKLITQWGDFKKFKLYLVKVVFTLNWNINSSLRGKASLMKSHWSLDLHCLIINPPGGRQCDVRWVCIKIPQWEKNATLCRLLLYECEREFHLDTDKKNLYLNFKNQIILYIFLFYAMSLLKRLILPLAEAVCFLICLGQLSSNQSEQCHLIRKSFNEI